MMSFAKLEPGDLFEHHGGLYHALEQLLPINQNLSWLIPMALDSSIGFCEAAF